ncbi:hypothetical protein SAMN05444920_12048 [Nonomuraea solani]|uniref:Peptidase inhibitor family I36 n=1 Tax=Nonomuraea solani TaxID=1144553 RepID=A0A1H6EXI8_9ACTN|nr:hypothetical protein [Nonomuraea solani]SEH01344.1 hypothetical protein SAMN05444920_12048 [Nonomuraea solani]
MKIARRVLVSLAAALVLSGLLTAPTAAQTTAQTTAQATAMWPSVTPSPEHWYTKSGWSQQQATDWVNQCPGGRFCTWIRNGNTYELFQFYRCQQYALSDWLGTSNYYNHQNVRVELLGSRHEHIRYLASNHQFITNWDPVWYINLCA